MEKIKELINLIRAGNKASANSVFSDVMSEKVSDALEQEKVRVAGKIYNK